MTKEYTYTVILEPQEEGGFTVLVPALPEVVTEGDSADEALAMAREAIELALEYRRDHGLDIPADTAEEVQIRKVEIAVVV
ncbi:MAG: type II toxin-antitoxin system HicB family antitoxin [Trueperaceae bacterium]|nr:MAG: type II toxin-antitoxin system HicB family antitoxin [Trueperaceae bacterium]